MTVLQKYLASEITRAVLLVLAALLSMQSFFDLMGELRSVGKGEYYLQHAFLYILMGLPGFAYEMMPLATLIGTIWTLSRLASSSEFTIMRVSSMSTSMAGVMLAKIGLVFVVVTFFLGEVLSPLFSEMAVQMKLRLIGSTVTQEFRTGLWAKDIVKDLEEGGKITGSRFLNVREVVPGGVLKGVKIYQFDTSFRMEALITADSANYRGNHSWDLTGVSEVRFPNIALGQEASLEDLKTAIVTRSLPTMQLSLEITPDIMGVLFADPDRLSANDLNAYTRHLAENNQQTERYEIAFWKKLIYPFAVLVMMALALPFAYLQVRAGGVSLKIFTGIMIGVSFYLINSLFSHIGMLNTWPALITALLPSLVYLSIAMGAMWWVENRG